MTKSDITLGAASVARHLATVAAGVLTAHGLAGGDQLASLLGAVAVFIATVGWSFIQNSKLLAQLCDNLPVSELEALAQNLMRFKAQGSNPLLIANIAQTAMAIAQQELLAAHPELAPPPPSPAPAPAAPAATPPVVTPGPVSSDRQGAEL